MFNTKSYNLFTQRVICSVSKELFLIRQPHTGFVCIRQRRWRRRQQQKQQQQQQQIQQHHHQQRHHHHHYQQQKQQQQKKTNTDQNRQKKKPGGNTEYFRDEHHQERQLQQLVTTYENAKQLKLRERQETTRTLDQSEQFLPSFQLFLSGSFASVPRRDTGKLYNLELLQSCMLCSQIILEDTSAQGAIHHRLDRGLEHHCSANFKTR